MKLRYLIILLTITSCSSNNELLMETVSDFERSNHEAVSKKAMIATQGRFSSLAGKEIMDMGGNIIDAMAAISFVISVSVLNPRELEGEAFSYSILKKKIKHTHLISERWHRRDLIKICI